MATYTIGHLEQVKALAASGRTLAIGETRLKVVKRIVRCAAVNVDPDTAERDLAIPQALQRRLQFEGLQTIVLPIRVLGRAAS